jgi:hypothetical protein
MLNIIWILKLKARWDLKPSETNQPSQIVKTFPVFYEDREFITVFTNSYLYLVQSYLHFCTSFSKTTSDIIFLFVCVYQVISSL